MKFLLIALLCICNAQDAQHRRLQTGDMVMIKDLSSQMPAKNTTLKWRRALLSEDSKTDLNEDGQAVVEMNVVLNTPHHIVSIENLHGLLNVECRSDAVIASFDGAANANVVNSWQLNSEPMLVIPSKYFCNHDRNVKWLLAKSWSLNGDTVTFITQDPVAAGVAGTFDLVAAPNAKDPINEIEESRDNWRRGWADIDRQAGFNFDFQKQTQFGMDMPFGDFGAHVQCDPCGIDVYSRFEVRVKGNLWTADYDFYASWEGKLLIDFVLKISPTSESGGGLPSKLDLLEVPLSPINIYGIFNLGPTFHLLGRADTKAGIDSYLRVGFTVGVENFKIVVSTTSEENEFNLKPVFKPVFDYKKLKPDAQIITAIAPQLSMEASVFQRELKGAAISLDNAIAANVLQDGSGLCAKVRGAMIPQFLLLGKTKDGKEVGKSEILNTCSAW